MTNSCNFCSKEERHEIECLIRNGLIELGDGYRAKNEELASVGLPFARAGNINGGFNFQGADRFPVSRLHRVGRKVSMPGDVLFTSKGTVGRFAYVGPDTEQFVYSPQLCFWRSLDHERIHPRWLYYWMHGPEFLPQFLGVARETDMADYVSLQNQRRFYITLPPLREQMRVAQILGAFDDKIEVNRRMCATLEEMARAIFRSWFVDFEPVRAKVAAIAEGRDPERSAMAAISGKEDKDLDTLPPETLASLRTTAALFPSSFTDSELGEIPEGWELKSIYEFASVIYGAPFSSTKFNTNCEGKPLVRIRDLKNEAPGVYTPEVHPKGYIIKPGNIVVGMDGEFRAYLWGGEEAWLNQRVCVFKPDLPENRCYLRESIRPQLEAVETSETATTVIHIGKGDIDRFEILDPGEECLQAFSGVVEPMLDKIVHAKQESRTLAALRDTLLPKLLSGELCVEAG